MTMASNTYGIFVRDAFGNTKAFDLDADTFKIPLVTDSYTPNFSTHDEYADITNEVSNGNGYATGGATLGSSTWAISGNYVVLDGNDLSWTTSTFTARGMVPYDDTLSGDPLVCAVTFGGDYSPVAGTLTVTLSASGLWRVSFA